MIFVTVGSQKFQFNRLLKAIDDLIEKGDIKEEVFAQTGVSDYQPKNYKYVDFTTREQFNENLDKCDLLITHGGTGVIVNALKKGKKVIAVPRLAKYGEHVDDHQMQLVDEMGKERMIEVCANLEDFSICISDISKKEYRNYSSNTKNILNEIEGFIQ